MPHIPLPALAAPVEYRPWRPNAWVLVVTGALLLGLSLGFVASLFIDRGPVGGDEYHLWRWEASTLLDNVFARAGIGPDPDDSEGERALLAYFKLTSALRGAEDSATPDVTLIATIENERSVYENDVERLLERYIGQAVASEGLQLRLPLFNAIKLTWPPVDFELTNPPQLLVRSPRDKIERSGDTLLKTGLSLGQVEAIEKKTTNAKTVTVVVPLGGLAAYPAIVRDDRSYDSLLDTASHEWVHHYLAFFPLGEQWGKGGEAETLNETTAELAGREIANVVRKQHPVQLPADANGAGPPGQPVDIDFTAEMRKLRLDVDALLAAGKVDDAEKLMEERRQFFNAHGVPIRRLNQAYFAFYGTYAASAQSSNPIGDKVDQVWALTKDVGVFLRVMRGVRNTADLDASIAALQTAAP
ncbi:MAG: hypothetical protein HYX53_12440 [Chloroflexi bacterium]|nr:hypothetical protein [Chloroflexota bacterium]